MLQKQIIILFIFGLFSSSLFAFEPERDKGISVHAMPERVAKLSNAPWGLQVRYAPYLKPEPAQPVLQSISDVLYYIKKQDPSVIENGLWVVTTNPGAYNEEELKFQELIKITLPKEGIPLFWVRGMNLDKGFTRY